MTVAATTVRFDPDVTTSSTADPKITAAERDLFKSPLLKEIWYSRWTKMYAAGWTGSKLGTVAAPVNAPTVPVKVNSGGPDDEPYMQAGSSDPVGILMTPAAFFPTTSKWTMWAVSRAATIPAPGLIGVVGNNGNSAYVQHRTSDLLRFVTRADVSGSNVVHTSATAASADYHFHAHSYDPETDLLSLYLAGEKVTEAEVALTFGSSRFSIFGAYDTAGDMDAEGRGCRIVSCGLLLDSIDDNADLLQLLNDAVASRMPSLFA